MDATTIGLQTNSIVLGKHSGRHALRNALEELGVRVDGQALNTAFKRFKEIADQQEARDGARPGGDRLRRDARAGRGLQPGVVRAARRVGRAARREGRGDDAGRRDASRARGPATARSTRCSRRSTPRPGSPGVLKEYHVAAVTADTDALGEVSCCRARGQAGLGPERLDRHAGGSARAYLRALSNALAGVRCRARRSHEREAGATAVADQRLHLGRRRAPDPLRRGALDEAPGLLAGRGFAGLRAADDAERFAHGSPGGRRRRADRGRCTSRPGRFRKPPRPSRSGVRAGRWWRSAAGA